MPSLIYSYENIFKKSLFMSYKKDVIYKKQPKHLGCVSFMKKGLLTLSSSNVEEAEDIYTFLIWLFGSKSKIYKKFNREGFIFRKRFSGELFLFLFFLLFFVHKNSFLFFKNIEKLRLKGDFYSLIEVENSSFTSLVLPAGLYPFYLLFE